MLVRTYKLRLENKLDTRVAILVEEEEQDILGSWKRV